jgi:hypothetical protein
MSLSRRDFLLGSSFIAGGFNKIPLYAQDLDPALLAKHVANVNGDQRLGSQDEALIRASMFAERGFDLIPRKGFDYRADVFGRGSITPVALDSFHRTIDKLGSNLEPRHRRPITIAWHYGWHNDLQRDPGTQTVRFKGGDYYSWDPEIETLFNDQKNEFGISVDALSWIPVRSNNNMESNYLKGFLNATNQSSRHAALLYESPLSLPVSGKRIDFLDQTVQVLLRQDFESMARFLVKLRDESDVEIFRLDGRPVVFIFGSHAWITEPLTAEKATAFEISMDHAREAFRVVFGQFPYLVGEEMLLSAVGNFGEDRRLRTRSFDGIYIYHHAENLKPTVLSGIDETLFMNDVYTENQLGLLRATYAVLKNLRNRYTGKSVLVIPNVAPGFAKPGLPKLLIDRSTYANFIKLIIKFHDRFYIEPEWLNKIGTAELPAPVYVVGSWNEEFEGHAVFPSSFNQSLSEVKQEGFDLAMAIKEAFGWNHYSKRSIFPEVF